MSTLPPLYRLIPVGDIDLTSSPLSSRASSPSTVHILPVPGLLRPSPVPGLLTVSPSWEKKFEKQKYSEQGGSFFKWIPNLKIYFQPDCEWCFTPDGTELGFCISSTMIWTAILLYLSRTHFLAHLKSSIKFIINFLRTKKDLLTPWQEKQLIIILSFLFQ